MKWLESRLVWGGLLVLAGILFLLENLDILHLADFIWGIVLCLGGLFFLGIYVSNKAMWWALIPGCALIGIGITILITELIPGIASATGGLTVLGGIGLGFILVYVVQRVHWWALIPGGVLITLVVVSVIDSIGLNSGAIFFLGLGLTFALVALAPTPQGRMTWAWIPAVILVVAGFLMLGTQMDMISYLLPAILLVAGGYVLIRAMRQK